MAKLVKFELLDSQKVFVNSETIRAVKPHGGNALIVYGDGADNGVVVKGDPATVAGKLIG